MAPDGGGSFKCENVFKCVLNRIQVTQLMFVYLGILRTDCTVQGFDDNLKKRVCWCEVRCLHTTDIRDAQRILSISVHHLTTEFVDILILLRSLECPDYSQDGTERRRVCTRQLVQSYPREHRFRLPRW